MALFLNKKFLNNKSEFLIQIGCGTHNATGKINQHKIVGGHKVAPKWKYPWMVAITAWRRKDKRWKHICGGALISSRHILTASHCFPTSLK